MLITYMSLCLEQQLDNEASGIKIRTFCEKTLHYKQTVDTLVKCV